MFIITISSVDVYGETSTSLLTNKLTSTYEECKEMILKNVEDNYSHMDHNCVNGLDDKICGTHRYYVNLDEGEVVYTIFEVN